MAALGSKLRTLEGGRIAFWCPGCNESHMIAVGEGPGPRWTFNGDGNRPTFRASVLVRSGHYMPEHTSKSCWCTYNVEHPENLAPFKCGICHTFVTDGQIEFLGDCTHELAGQTVPLPDYPTGSDA